ASAWAALPNTSIATVASATTETTAAFIDPSSKRRTHGEMEIRRLLPRAPIEIESVVYADRAERRDPAETAAGGLTELRQIELGLEEVHVADVEERGQPGVERQRAEVLEVPEDLARVADEAVGPV